MLSGLKFIPQDQIDKGKDETLDDSGKERDKSCKRKEKFWRKKKDSRHNSSDDEGLERINSGSRKKKKWYNSDENLSSSSEESDSHSESEGEWKKHKRRKGKKKGRGDVSKNEHRHRSKKKRRKQDSSEDESSDTSQTEKSSEQEKHHKGRKSESNEEEKRGDNGESQSPNYNIVRKEMGLDWMLRPKENIENTSDKISDVQPPEAPHEPVKKDNPRELNPYLRNNGSGYPEESNVKQADHKELLPTKVIGDGGASWRLKALKRAQEQASREGRKLQEVVEERWGSMGQFAASLASHNVAPTHAHLHAIKGRRKGLNREDEKNTDGETDRTEKYTDQRNTKEDVTPRHPKMIVPKVHDSLSWGKRGKKTLSREDAALVSAAMSGLNQFSNDGSFMDKFSNQKNDKYGEPSSSSHGNSERIAGPNSGGIEPEETNEEAGTVSQAMSANQLAAKALQLRMKGKHEEAEKLLKEAEKVKTRQDMGSESSRASIDGTTSSFIMHDVSSRQKKKEDDADMHLARKIVHNHRYSISGQADDEYDYDGSPRKKAGKKAGGSTYKSDISNSAKRILTQQERCQFCFENPGRPKHLVLAIANFTYLSLPQRQPIPGHCGILTLQHEASTRTIDDNVWNEFRNFKKCLIMMFEKQEKDVVFLETVLGLTQQRRHCMIECVPLPQEIAKQAPVYFKKAIDEAEDEWSQHNAKKLIDTSQKGLRGSIPKNFPYFHVEFGLNRGFVHVIDDEKGFKSSFGLDVIRGMLQLPAEDMHRRSRHEPVEVQKQAVASFARDWEPFDWTKQLD